MLVRIIVLPMQSPRRAGGLEHVEPGVNEDMRNEAVGRWQVSSAR